MEEKDCTIEEFFTKEEYAKISDYEKLRYKNMRKNYEMMISLGLPAIKPEFMKGPKGRKKKTGPELCIQTDSEGSDAEWTPNYESKKSHTDCEDCNREYNGDCPHHGPLVIIEDKKINMQVADRAMKTLPDGLDVNTSCIPDAGLGVWSQIYISKGVRFGPYEGTSTKNQEEAHATGYSWQVIKTGALQNSSIYRKILEAVNCEENQMPPGSSKLKASCTGKTNKDCYNTLCDQGEIRHIKNKSGSNEGYNIDIGYKVHTCNVCGRIFRRLYTLQKHMRKHNSVKTYQSDEAIRAFDSQNIHQEEKLDEANLMASPLQEHVEKDEEQMSYKSSDSQNHMRTCTSPTPCKCDVCGNSFSQFGHLQRHIRTHTGQKPNKCDVCGKSFSQFGNLQIHMRTHTGQKPYKCDVSGKFFSQSVDIQNHMRTHTGQKPYKCDVCGKPFSRSSNLQNHMRTHTGQMPYKCDVCGKPFSHSGNLQRHMRTHTGQKPYKCDVCGKPFSHSGDLQRHMRTHTGQKPYQCDVCEKSFSHSGNLQNHMRTHTGQKPYKCDVSGKSFSHSSDLQRHMRTHTGQKPYKCDVCGKPFSLSGNLQRHARTHNRSETLQV